MNVILKVILAVYNFFVGDLVILIGVVLTMVILALINFVGALAPLEEHQGSYWSSACWRRWWRP